MMPAETKCRFSVPLFLVWCINRPSRKGYTHHQTTLSSIFNLPRRLTSEIPIQLQAKNGFPPKISELAIQEPLEGGRRGGRAANPRGRRRGAASSSSATVAAVRDGLRRLGDVYGHIEETVHLPRNQARTVQQRKELDAEMDRSLDLIDLCNATQENLAELKAAVQDLLAAVRRGDDASVQAKVQSYARSVKNARKQLRKAGRRTTAAGVSGKEERECRLIGLLLRARLVAASLLGSALCLVGVAKQAVTPRRSLVSKALQRRSAAVVCEEGQVQALERVVGDLERGAELLFRRMVQTRVALLNVLSS